VKLWNASTGAQLATLAGHTDKVTACGFAPDGRRLVTASADRTLKVWDGWGGAELATFAGHTDTVIACAFSPDGSRLASASFDRTVKVWDVASGALVGEFVGSADMSAVTWHPRGERLAVGATSGVVYLLQVEKLDAPTPLLTAVVLFRRRKRYDAKASFRCPGCGRSSNPSPNVLDAVRAITGYQPVPVRRGLVNRLLARKGTGARSSRPGLIGPLPVEAWGDPRLLSECPHCREALRFNPFVVDNS
jgi:hypothetical protein